jgi:hypothetical protein
MLPGAPSSPAYAYRERARERAKAMENPDMKRPIEATAERFARLAEKFESQRKM